MFTGIIQAIGTLHARDAHGGDLSLDIRAEPAFVERLETGASVSVNGVCLTVAGLEAGAFRLDVSRETLSRTALGRYAGGDRVNLEAAVTPSTALGGHLVSGHVDGVGTVQTREDDQRSVRFRIRAPEALARYLAPKGSVTVDGVSLTLNDVSGAEFEVNIVPHTLAATIIDGYRPGYEVNLEVDVVARYLERLLEYRRGDR